MSKETPQRILYILGRLLENLSGSLAEIPLGDPLTNSVGSLFGSLLETQGFSKRLSQRLATRTWNLCGRHCKVSKFARTSPYEIASYADATVRHWDVHDRHKESRKLKKSFRKSFRESRKETFRNSSRKSLKNDLGSLFASLLRNLLGSLLGNPLRTC